MQSRVPVTADLTLDDLDLLGAYRDFLEETGLDRLRPQQDIRLTMPGDYVRLLEHIRMHRFFLETDQSRSVPWSEAVADWYDNVYMPVVEALRTEDILSEFPGHTEGDLYFWMIEHAHYVREETGQQISSWEAVRDYARRFGRAPGNLWQRVRRRLLALLLPCTSTGPASRHRAIRAASTKRRRWCSFEYPWSRSPAPRRVGWPSARPPRSPGARAAHCVACM